MYTIQLDSGKWLLSFEVGGKRPLLDDLLGVCSERWQASSVWKDCVESRALLKIPVLQRLRIPNAYP